MSNLRDSLLKYNTQVIPYIDQVFKEASLKTEEVFPPSKELVSDYKKFLQGGKKLRGWEIVLGYEMFGGKNSKEILLGSLIIEIIHSFLLIHDDIMDNDPLRRGEETLHVKYAKAFGSHHGLSMALNMGDEGMFWACRLFGQLKFSAERKIQALEYLSRILMEVGMGQAMDITFEAEKRFSEKDVLRVHRYKTAEYTIPGPIILGAILAGADKKVLKEIKSFGLPIGTAFQLRDDELGMFSTEEELGKPVDSDLRESKVTILIVKSFENTKGEDLEFLKYAYGNKNLGKNEIERVREIIKNSGALEYSQKLAKKLVDDGKKFIPKITNDVKYQGLLNDLADFVAARNS